MTAVAPVTSIVQYLDANGNPLSAGTVDVYLAGTTTRSTTWADQAQGTPNANPVVLDSRGQASIWLDPTITYDFSVKDSTGTLQKTYQNVQAAEFATWVSDQNANSHKITNLTAGVASGDAVNVSQIKGPAFAAYMSASQSITSATLTKVNIDTKVFDTATCFDATAHRFTPNVAGYYQVNGVVRGTATSGTNFIATIYKNGAEWTRGGELAYPSGITSDQQTTVSETIFLNGSTDYIELWGLVTGTSPQFHFVLTSATCRFSASLVRLS